MIELYLVGCKVAPNNFSSAQRVFTNFQKAAACPHNSRRFFLRHFGGELQEGRVQLWKEKIGAIEPFSGNLATIWGDIKEHEALERYKLLTGNTVLFTDFQVYRNNNLNDNDDNWLGCSPDGVVDNVVYGLPYRGVLEIKCPYYDGDKQKSYPWSRIPLRCIPQAQGLMEILDKDWMDLYCWTANGSSLFRLYRDQAYWELMEVALSDFWFKQVLPGRDLYRKYPFINPLILLRSLRPAPRHELCPSIVIASKYLVDNSVLLMRGNTGETAIGTISDCPQVKYWGNASEIGDTILESPQARKITFTGSTAVGKKLMAAAAGTIKKVDAIYEEKLQCT
ncbi:hypothetical protein IFM89_000360, partial [Coptis chinensis]